MEEMNDDPYVKFKHVTDHVTYSTISKAHKSLSEIERRTVIDQLTKAYSQYEIEVMQIAAFRKHLYRLYERKVDFKQSVAYLSRDFNMSVKGHNAGVAMQMGNAIVEAYVAENNGCRAKAVKILLDAGIHIDVLTSDEVIKLLKNNPNNLHAQTALSLLKQIEQHQEALFRSIIKLVARLAKQAWRGGNVKCEGLKTGRRLRLAGEVIQECDLIQQAILSAKRAIELYKPGLHDGQTFTSYVTKYVDGMLCDYIKENSRVVPIPRKVMDRYTPVQEVIDMNPILVQYNQYDYEGIARAASIRKGGIPYTAREVEELLLHVSKETASLDLEVPVSRDGSADLVTLGESLINQDLSQEVKMDRAYLKANILNVIREYTDMQEYTVLKLRWGGDGEKPLSLDQAAKAYVELTGLDMNKGKVAKIELSVFQRLRDSNDPRLKELLEVANDSNNGRSTMLEFQNGAIRISGRKISWGNKG